MRIKEDFPDFSSVEDIGKQDVRRLRFTNVASWEISEENQDVLVLLSIQKKRSGTCGCMINRTDMCNL